MKFSPQTSSDFAHAQTLFSSVALHGILLTARPWAERGSCFARDLLFLLTARPWAERGSCFTRDLLLLTARPWAERSSCFTRDLLFFNRAALGRARFLLWTEFFFLSVSRLMPPLGQTSSHAMLLTTLGQRLKGINLRKLYEYFGCYFAVLCEIPVF